MAIAPTKDKVIVGGRDGKECFIMIDIVVMKLLKIEEDGSAKTVEKNFITSNKASAGVKGALEIRWNQSKILYVFIIINRVAKFSCYIKGTDHKCP